MLTYLNDILIFSKNPEEYKQHIKQVLQALWDTGIRYKPAKCQFHVRDIEFLEHIISLGQIQTSDKKVHTILE